MASTITLDGQLTDWTNVDRLDFGMTGLNGSKIYGHFVDGTYHFAVESSTVSIDANSTMWLNTDKSTATGYSFWGLAIGADYKIEFEADGLGGTRPTLYALTANGDAAPVTNGVSFARSADGKFVELAIDKTKIGNSSTVSTLIDLNDKVFLPGDYTQAPLTLTDELTPVRTDTNLKVAIVFSEASAANYFSDTAYSQLIMAAQSQAIAAGVPFDILTENDLTSLSKVVNYDAIIFPSFANVNKNKLSAIEDVLRDAVNKYGISLVAAGNFMTNDETGAAIPGNSYARMESLLGVKRVGGNNVDEVTVTASGGPSDNVIGYGEGEQIRTYVKNATSQVGTAYFDGVNSGSTQVLATQNASDGTHNAVLATQTGGNNVYFATEAMLADSNMLQHAIGWAARPEDVPELKLQMGRQASIFAARNDMDQSQEIDNVNGGIYTSMLSIVEKWKADFNFVGSYYVNIGNNAANGQTTDWAKSKPIYDQLLAMGNEIGTHSYTHPEDTNLLTPAQIQFEFQQSKLLLEQKLGITIQGAAVPGAPESLATSELIGQYFSYMSGGYTGVGAGYPGAFGYIAPDSDSVYLAPNIKFDFSLVEALPIYGGGMTAEQAKQEWIKEFNELSLKSDMPVFVWPWHDYGPTQWVINEGGSSPYTEAMFTEFLRYAYEQDTEFVTMLDLAQRIKAFEKAGFNYSFDSANNTMTATVTTDVTANQIGTFALDVEKGKTIASVSGWYAYDNDSVFMDADGGTFKIKLGSTPEDVTHITALPSRAQLLSVTGDGINLNFSIRGEGKIAVDLIDPRGRELTVTGAEIASRNSDKLELTVSGNGDHNVAVTLRPAVLNVVLANDTGASVNDRITSVGNLTVTGIASGATVEYSLDGTTWSASFTPVQGVNTVQIRQIDTVGEVSGATTISFTLDTLGPTSSILLPPLDGNKTSIVTITFSEVPEGFDPNADLDVVGGELVNVTVDVSGMVYKGTFTAFSNTDFASVSLKADSYTDKAGNVGGVASAGQEVVGEAPTITSNGGGDAAALFTAEGTTVVTTVTADNPNAGQVLTYSIDGPDASFFTIDATTGKLEFVAAPAYEVPQDAGHDNIYDLQVIVSDAKGRSDVQIISVSVTDVVENSPPTITSNGGGATASLLTAENGTAVTVVTAADPDSGALTYSIAGGTDAARFTVNATTGALAFLNAPDFEAPTDSDSNNIYDVTVQVDDGNGGTDTQSLAVTVTNAAENSAPVITSNGGVGSALVSVTENATAVTTVKAADADGGPLAYSIVGGADASRFAMNAITGALVFLAAPDFEAPTDAGGNNVYDVIVQVADGSGAVDTQAIAVTVTNVNGTSQVSNALVITGSVESDRLTGQGGNNTLRGLDGNDTLDGGSGNDTLEGGSGNDSLIGGAGNDLLDGGAGNDAMAGGANNDTYVVDSSGDTVTEAASGGTDLVRTILSTYTLGANLENLTFTGTGSFHGTGNASSNVITGGSGADTINGGVGIDRLAGLGGNDTYIVDNTLDVIEEASNGGVDTVVTTASLYVLTANAENLSYSGTGRFTGTGNASANSITGGSNADILRALGGNDVLSGLGGNDTLTGDTGDDIFLATISDGNDRYNGDAGRDTYSLAGTTATATVNLLIGTATSSQTGSDLLDSIEIVIGGSGADRFVAGTGLNVFTGGAGNDTFAFTTEASAGTGANRDQVLDFSGGDRIDVSGIDASNALAGNNAFTFAGQIGTVIGGVGQLARGQIGFRYLTDTNGVTHTIIEGNVNATAAADFQIDLVGQRVLTIADFIL